MWHTAVLKVAARTIAVRDERLGLARSADRAAHSVVGCFSRAGMSPLVGGTVPARPLSAVPNNGAEKTY